eukprot:Clim_evm37s241 gene=Clim_evmTU37s241
MEHSIPDRFDLNETLLRVHHFLELRHYFGNPEEFTFVPEVTPLTAISFVVTVWTAYWLHILIGQLILGGWARNLVLGKQETTRAAAPTKSHGPSLIDYGVALHNLILTIWSAHMAGCIAYDLYEAHQDSKFSVYAFCMQQAELPQPLGRRAFYHLFIYYVSKFYELFDTTFLVLKKKPVIFLHWYHHSIVIAMVWLWLYDHLAYGHIGMLFNTVVHVIMYNYYMLSALKINVPWKRYITSLQIFQFMCSFALAIPYVYMCYSGGCLGWNAFIFSCFTNGSFLLLFIQFSKRTYGSAKKSSARKPAVKKSVTNGKKRN